jgi:hypothetical protein
MTKSQEKKEVIKALKKWQGKIPSIQLMGKKAILELQKRLIDLNPTEKQFHDGFTNTVLFSETIYYLFIKKND